MNTAARDCIIIHGCPSEPEGDAHGRPRSYDKHWIPWVREQLIARGIRTQAPLMPEPWAPRYDAYKLEFEQHPVDRNTILIGHSCGAAFLVRWLGETKRSIDTLVLVAPWKVPRAGDLIRKAFYDWPIDATIRERVGSIVLFTSDTEAEAGKRSLAIYHAALGGKIVDLPGRGHYISASMDADAFPELLSEIA